MCESARIVKIDGQAKWRYKCSICGVLLYGSRGLDTVTPKTLKTYACRHIGKDPMTKKRRLICQLPATHSTGANTYCDKHGGGPPSHRVAAERRSARQLSKAAKQRQREADMRRFADRHVSRLKAELEVAPLPEPVKDGGGVGGVHIW